MSAPLTFGIDFDGTFAADPATFRILVRWLRARGHRTIMVTQRCRKFAEEIAAVLGPVVDLLPVVYAAGSTKDAAALRDGYAVDIWIDDNPFSVGTAMTYRGCEDELEGDPR